MKVEIVYTGFGLAGQKIVSIGDDRCPPLPDSFFNDGSSSCFDGDRYTNVTELKRKKQSMHTTIIPSNGSGCCVELIHYPDDPASWIVRSSKKFLWFRTNSVTMRFISKEQALAYAQNSTK